MSNHRNERAETNQPLQSRVLTSPADEMLRRAIEVTLNTPISDRSRILEQFVQEIEVYITAYYPERPWTCSVYIGTDGSRVFRGGVGHSLVIDTTGRLWRARSYEDFDTTYTITENSCEIESLTPLYSQMREYLPEWIMGQSGEMTEQTEITKQTEEA